MSGKISVIVNSICIISNTCMGMEVYKIINPGVNPHFINYTSPLIGTLFKNDMMYLKFVENYEYYVRKIPSIVRDGLENYPIIKLDDVQIHCIHDAGNTDSMVINKWNGRLLLSDNLTRVCIWSDIDFMDFHDDLCRRDSLGRFYKIPMYSIFLTKNPDEVVHGDNYRSVFIPEWEGLSLHGGGNVWINRAVGTAILFNNIIMELGLCTRL